MNTEAEANRRILIIDDNRAIHDDFRKILGAASRVCEAEALAQSQAALFGGSAEPDPTPVFHVDCASQGQEGVAMVRRARETCQPYALAFVDARMPPGWDGIETIARLWEEDPHVQVVICTAYSDYSWQQIRRELVHMDRVIILKKPFDSIEVLQLADSLTRKWEGAHEDRRRLHDLQGQIAERNRDLRDAASIDAQLDAGAGRVTAADRSRVAQLQAQRRQVLAQALGHALRERQLSVHYQPLVEIASRRVVSLEALVRWHHPELGNVSPAEFIPIAEHCGLIVPIGEHVLRTVCEQIVRWEREGAPVVPVAVNVSAVQLEHPRLWEFIRCTLRDTGVLPHRLALELTESVMIKGTDSHAPALRKLRDDGVRIQMDDFGTGYSSLGYLKQLPVDTLKIDRSFIRQLATNPTDEAIVSAILAMSRSLRLRVVAEGVESPAQLEVLGRHGCELAQGFYFCRPLPAHECRELLVDLAGRSSFTDTLRMRVVRAPAAPDIAPIAGKRGGLRPC